MAEPFKPYTIAEDNAGLFNAVTRTLAAQGHRVYFSKRLRITEAVFDCIYQLGLETNHRPPLEDEEPPDAAS